MAGMFDGVIDEIEADLNKAASEIFLCYATKVREDNKKGVGGIPFDTGLLRAGLQLTRQTYTNGKATALFESTARSKEGFDYPTHLDLGGRHSGWWRNVNKQKMLEDCAREIFPRYNL